jgi:hypothetical protein
MAGQIGNVMDVFHTDAYSLLSLTDAFNKVPYTPRQIGKLGIFKEVPISTTTVGVEELDGSLSLLFASQRGAPPAQNRHFKPKLRSLVVPHLQLEDSIQADEIQNVRAFGTADQLAGVQGVVNQRLTAMGDKHDATLEYQRINALQGLLLDADGETVIYNLFAEFGIGQTTVDLNLGDGENDQQVLANITGIKDAMDTELGAMAYDGARAYLGANLWNEFITSPAIATAFKFYTTNVQTMQPLRDDLRYKGFEFGGVIWEKYRGTVNGIAYLQPNEGIAFPLGCDIFRTYFAPANFIETVNTLGLPRYAKQLPNRFGTAVDIYTQSNPLSITLRPGASIRLVSSTL